MIIRREALKAALQCRSTEASRYNTTFINIRPDGTVEATDGSILVRVHDKHPQEAGDFPQVPGVGSPLANPETQTLIPGEVVQKLIAATPKKSTIPILCSINVGAVDGHRYAVATDLTAPVVVCLDAAQENDFPQTDRAMVRDGARAEEGIVRVTLAAETLEKLAKTAKEIGRAHGIRGVCLEIPTHERHRKQGDEVGLDILDQVRFTMTGQDLTIEGVVMPCRL